MMSFVVDLIAIVFGMPRALFPEIADESFAGPDAGGLAFALLFAAIPAGAVIGGVFSGWVSRVSARAGRSWWRSSSRGLAMVGFGVAVGLGGTFGSLRTTMLVVAVLMLIVGGAADMASAAFRTSMLQSAAPTPSVAGCRASSPSSSPAALGSPTSPTAPRRRRRHRRRECRWGSARRRSSSSLLCWCRRSCATG